MRIDTFTTACAIWLISPAKTWSWPGEAIPRSIGRWALRKVAQRVVLVHRRNGFSAVASSVDNMRRAVAAAEMEFMVGAIAAMDAPDGTLKSIEISR